MDGALHRIPLSIAYWILLAGVTYGLTQGARVVHSAQRHGAISWRSAIAAYAAAGATGAASLAVWILPSGPAIPAACLGAAFAVASDRSYSAAHRRLTARAHLRRTWTALEALGSGQGGQVAADDETRARLEHLLSEARDASVDDATRDVAELLAVQAPLWVFAPDYWSRALVEGEIELYRRARNLLPDDPPPLVESKLSPERSWQVFDAYLALSAEMQAEERDPERERQMLADLQTFRDPQTSAFIDAVAALVEADLDPGRLGDDAPALIDRAHREMDRLWPSVWVFRGA